MARRRAIAEELKQIDTQRRALRTDETAEFQRVALPHRQALHHQYRATLKRYSEALAAAVDAQAALHHIVEQGTTQLGHLHGLPRVHLEPRLILHARQVANFLTQGDTQ